MKTIFLTRGLHALVSDRDFPKLRSFNWYALPCRGYVYAARKVRGAIRLMHWDVLGTKFGDHRNHNTLDNTRANLRYCTQRQNAQNRNRRVDNQSGYKGVSLHHGKWQTRITIAGRRISLGHFFCPVVAAMAYDRAANYYFGKFAVLNFPKIKRTH